MRFEFVKSAVWPKDFPTQQKPEIAIVGRSNAGKSSLINAFARNSKMAKVSGKPGKTTTINFFATNAGYNVVDLPGYGFAARSHSEREQWRKMIEQYFSVRGQLSGVLLIMDIRRSWTDEEEQLAAFFDSLDIAMCVILTKSDKLSRMRIQQAVKSMKNQLQSELVFAVSSSKNRGVHEVLQFIKDSWMGESE